MRDARSFGPACAQGIAGEWGPYTAEFIAAPPVSEDCLTLNLWRPKATGKAPLPVLVFIHGGAFQGGAGSLPIYNGAELATRGAIVVTINYRVGVFGFLAHPALTAESLAHSSGNYGLLDQIAALQWIRANVGRFGGDAANVTIAGESAGAASVNDLIVSPRAKGLFAKAIALSGASMAIDAPTLAEGEAAGVALAARVGAKRLEQLRAVPSEDLIAATTAAPAEGGRPPIVFVPHIDRVVLPHDPTYASRPIASAVPLLTGFNDAEMIDLAVQSPQQFEAAVNTRYGAFAGRLLSLYPHGDAAEVSRSNVELARDRYMTGLILWARARTASSRQPIYAYRYNHPYPAARGGAAHGAFHSSELPYIFGTLGLGERVFTAADRAVSRQWQDRVLAFMRSGDPSVGTSRWSRITPRSVNVMIVGDRPGERPAVSTPARFAAFAAYAAAGGNLGLM